MDNDEVLGHLLEIESKAAALVNDAEAEADRRVAEAEKHSRDAFDERCHAEREKLEGAYQHSKGQAREKYDAEMAAYRQGLSSMPVDMAHFSALLNKLIAGGT